MFLAFLDRNGDVRALSWLVCDLFGLNYFRMKVAKRGSGSFGHPQKETGSREEFWDLGVHSVG